MCFKFICIILLQENKTPEVDTTELPEKVILENKTLEQNQCNENTDEPLEKPILDTTEEPSEKVEVSIII